MAEKNLNPCPDFGPFKDSSLNIEPPSKECTEEQSQKDVAFFEDILKQKTGIGQQALCDPMQTGNITQDLSRDPDRGVIYRYPKAIRGCDEALMDLFRGMIVLDEQGVGHPAPIIWATQERAVAAVIQTNVRKDNSLVVDRIKLPMLAIYSNSFAPNWERYSYHQALNYFQNLDNHPGLTFREKRDRDTVFGLARGIPIDIGYQLVVWTLYLEDMNQLVEQIMTKFSPVAYIRIQGVQWETIVKIDSIANNLDTEPGEAQRVIKFQFNFTAETYIPQPIARKKSVLNQRIEVANSINEEEITEILARLEIKT